VAAAPRVLDDLPVSSPELALVDLDLAVRLRADIRTGAEFRPRPVVRPEYRLLHPDVVPPDVSPDPASVDVVLPVDIVIPEVTAADAVGDGVHLELALDLPAVDGSDLPDYIVLADGPHVEDLAPEAGAVAEEDGGNSDYPVLPDLGEASVALEESDVALRNIREQMAAGEVSHRRRGLRTGFIVASGLGAVAALAVFVVDVELGVATVPAWLGF